MVQRMLVVGLMLLAAQCARAADNVVQSLRLLDLDGALHQVPSPDAQLTAILFMSTDCPIGNRYVPYLNELHERYRASQVAMCAVISDPLVSRSTVAQWRKNFTVTFPVLIDSTGELARELKPKRTPEAFVMTPDGVVRYRGRIDD